MTIDNYLELHSSGESVLLQKISRETHLKTTQPNMLSGHVQGRFLSLLSKIVAPNRILEIGTFTGYSTLCLAEGLTENGKIYTLDVNQELEKMCRGFFKESDVFSKIEYIVQDAKITIPTLDETFDLVFIDADKENYCTYYDLIKPKVRKGGIILTDNVLWHGKIINEKKDTVTQKIHEFNEKVKNDEEVEVVIVPIRDGISLIRKK